MTKRAAWGTSIVGAVLVLTAPVFEARQPASQSVQREDTRVWSDLQLPGGRAAVARAAGLDPGIDRSRLVLEIVRSRINAASDSGLLDGASLLAYLTWAERLSVVLESLQAMPRRPSIAALVNAEPTTSALLRQLLDLIGLSFVQGSGGARVTVRPPDDPLAAGLDVFCELAGIDRTALARTLDEGGEIDLALEHDVAPLPLTPDVWQKTVLDRSLHPSGMLRAILEDPRATLLYHGLASLDGETLAFMARRPAFLSALHRRHAAAFATFGRSVTIRDERLVTPGGAAMEPLWEQLAREKLSAPDRFIESLLGRARGRAAYLYDTLAHVEAPTLQFAVGGPDGAPPARAKRFEALASVFATVHPQWDIERRPFFRPPADPALVLRLVRVDVDGRLLGPAERRMWQTVFTGSVPSGGDESTVDAPWLLEQICLSPVAVRRERLHTLLFGQRVFRAPAANAAHVVAALQGFSLFPALGATLERIGIEDPAIYAGASARAAALTAQRRRETAIVTVTGFQSALALVARAKLVGSIDADTTAGLVRSLVAIEPGESGAYEGRLDEWIEDRLLAALGPGAPPDAGNAPDAESVLLAGLSGRATGADRGNGSGAAPITWEGWKYRVDVAHAERERLADVRRRQRTNSLADVLEFGRAARTIARRPGGEMADPLESLDTTAGRLEPANGFAMGNPRDSAARSRGAFSTPGREDRRVRVAADLAATADAMTADALRSLVYAIHLGDPDGPALLGSNVAQRHTLGFDEGPEEQRMRVPWSIASEVVGTGKPWHVRGSLLSLDVALPRFALRRIGSGGGVRPSLNDAARDGFATNVALMSPVVDDTGVPRDLLAAIERGRRRLNDMTDDPGMADTIARATGMSEWRRELLRWAAGHDPASVAHALSLTELVWLGLEPGQDVEAFDGWGSSALAATGCLCLRFPDRTPWEEFTGRHTGELIPTRVADLTLRVLQGLDDLDLPASLARGVLRAATQDFIDEVDSSGTDDWWSLVRHAGSLEPMRLEDYVSALAGWGALVPVSDDRPGGPPASPPSREGGGR